MKSRYDVNAQLWFLTNILREEISLEPLTLVIFLLVGPFLAVNDFVSSKKLLNICPSLRPLDFGCHCHFHRALPPSFFFFSLSFGQRFRKAWVALGFFCWNASHLGWAFFNFNVDMFLVLNIAYTLGYILALGWVTIYKACLYCIFGEQKTRNLSLRDSFTRSNFFFLFLLKVLLHLSNCKPNTNLIASFKYLFQTKKIGGLELGLPLSFYFIF